MIWDLIVIGAVPAGLSIAYEAGRAGVGRVLVLEPGDRAVPRAAVGRHGLTVRHQARVARIEPRGEGAVLVETGTETFVCRVCVDARHLEGDSPLPEVPRSVVERVHPRLPDLDVRDLDVLVVGDGERAVADATRLEEDGARVVLALTGDADRLSRLSRETLDRLEHDRRLTILWRSSPASIEDVGGHPMVFFADRRTPDLQFDHVVVAHVPPPPPSPLERVYVLGSEELASGHGWSTIAERHGAELGPLRPAVDTRRLTGALEMEDLRRRFYNATITHFGHSHEDLWVLRVRPDVHEVSHLAGQYATLGLGYWEPRVDDADEGLSEDRRRKMIRRSYSISSRVFDAHGYLVDPSREEEIELYIVHVRPDGDRVPALTPRLADKRVGDRVYLGPKVTGRYTLDAVTDPGCDVVFLATGTGEAPHNAMIAELFRKGHHGRIVSVVTVRYLRDLGYERVHRRLEERFPNYRYLVVPTREPGAAKRYIQDVVSSGELDDLLDPGRSHVFLCGNPAMIGLPAWHDGEPMFPLTPGVAELLHRRGFTIDRRGEIGNVHYEEYW